MVDNDTAREKLKYRVQSGHDPKHYYLVSYTAHNPFEGDTLNGAQEVGLDYPWKPGDMGTVMSQINGEMVKAGYDRYSKPIITSVFYMGEF